MYTRVALLACAVAAVAVPAPEAEPVHLPIGGRARLGPRADGTVDFPGLLLELNQTLKKYNYNHVLYPLSHYLPQDLLGGILEERGVGTVHLKDQGNDIEYYGPVTTGTTAKQTFTIDFDTGSADFFVPGPNCPSCHGGKYNEKGQAEGNTTSVTYGSGSITGKNYFDQVCAGGLCASHTNLISLTSAQGFSTSKSAGLMGMGFSTIAQSKQPTFMENLISQGKVTKPEFSFYLGREKSGTGSKSVLTLGGKDKSKYTGAATSHKVTKKGYWQLAIDGLAVGGSTSILGGGQSAIDTGTTVIIAPDLAETGFAAEFGAIPIPIVGTGSATETAFAYQCNNKKTVSVVFGGKKYAISAQDLNLGTLTSGLATALKVPEASGLCVLAIIADQIEGAQEFYVVGDTFLKNWYATFSFAKGASVSFAKSV